MIAFIFILLGLIFLGIDYKKGYINGSCSISNTLSLKGIFVILVFLAHVSEYLINCNNIFDIVYFKIKTEMGQLIVVYFLFFSGYGLCYSIKKKGIKYVCYMPKNRIFRTLIHFDFVIIIYVIIGFLLNNYYSIRTIFLSLVGWDTVGNSNWYIFAIMYLYLSTYVSYKLAYKIHDKIDNFFPIFLNTIFVLIYIIVISMYKGTWWYDTVICYILGMYYCFFKEKLDSLIKNNYILVLTICIIGYFFARYITNYYISFFLKEVFFMIFLLLFSMKISIKNRYLEFFGKNIFGIYILQRLPMIVLSYYKINEINFYLFLIVSFILTIILTVVINKILEKIDNYILRIL